MESVCHANQPGKLCPSPRIPVSEEFQFFKRPFIPCNVRRIYEREVWMTGRLSSALFPPPSALRLPGSTGRVRRLPRARRLLQQRVVCSNVVVCTLRHFPKAPFTHANVPSELQCVPTPSFKRKLRLASFVSRYHHFAPRMAGLHAQGFDRDGIYVFFYCRRAQTQVRDECSALEVSSATVRSKRR